MELAVWGIELLENLHDIGQLLVIVDEGFKAALSHVCLKALLHFLLRIALEIHEDWTVQINHSCGLTSLFIDFLEPLNCLMGLLDLNSMAIDDLTTSSFDYDLSREPSVGTLILDDDLVLSRFYITSIHVYVVLWLFLSLLLLFNFQNFSSLNLSWKLSLWHVHLEHFLLFKWKNLFEPL